MSTELMVIIPVLELDKKSDSDLETYCEQREEDLTDHAADFPGLNPTVAMLTGQRTIFAAALVSWRRGNTASTIVKNRERGRLERLLWRVAWNCADIADDDQAIFALSGFNMKQKGVPHNYLDTPTDFELMDSVIPNSLMSSFKGVAFKKSYEIEINTDSSFGSATLVAVVVCSSSPALIPELGSGTRYYGRVRAIGARDVVSGWSNIASRIVQ